jgi:hypothetical protein
MTDTSTTKDCKEYPTLGYRFFLYDPNDGITFWKTEEERDKAAEDAIDSYLDDEWSDEVSGVVAGVVTHHTVEIDRVDKVGQLDEDGYDEAGQYWPSSDYDYSCNYALKPFTTTPTEPNGTN